MALSICFNIQISSFTRRFTRGLLLLAASSAALSPSTGLALQVQTQVSLRFQSLEGKRPETGLLRAGSIVDVPDQYQVRGSDGRVNPELSMNNWLRSAGQAGEAEADHEGGVYMKAGGNVDFFYPVKIVSAAPGSHLPTYRGGVYFLALRVVNRDSNGRMSTREDTSVIQGTAAPASASTEPTEASGGACLDGRCARREPTPSPAFSKLVLDLRPALAHAQRHSNSQRRRTAVDFSHIRREFQRTCGFSLDSFLPVIKQRSNEAGVPPSIMLGIMVQESSGHCFNVGHNRGSSDHGLFGLNSLSTRIRSCTSHEKQWLRRYGVAGLERGPRCIENPLINLDSALARLKQKMSAVTHPYSAFPAHTNGFDERRLKDASGRYTQDAWRLAVSAYNGGERWVMTAKSDLERFNRSQGANLDPHNWEDLRVFYLRHFLGSYRERHYFGQPRDGRTKTAYLNLAYTENVVPRGRSGSSEARSISELWSRSERP